MSENSNMTSADNIGDLEGENKAARSAFLKSYDFMKLGQAINHKNWQIAAMTSQRMQKRAQELGISQFERQFVNIRQCLIHKQEKQAKDILALVIARRAQMLKEIEGKR